MRIIILLFVLFSFPAFAKEKCNFITFNKTSITEKDILNLTINRCLQHPFNELSIETPANRYFFISNENPKEDNPTIYSKSQFDLIKSLDLTVKSLTATEYKLGAKPGKLFVEKGYYKFRFGHELQTDVEHSIFEKDIYYSP